jgi:hypothetical protein
MHPVYQLSPEESNRSDEYGKTPCGADFFCPKGSQLAVAQVGRHYIYEEPIGHAGMGWAQARQSCCEQKWNLIQFSCIFGNLFLSSLV